MSAYLVRMRGPLRILRLIYSPFTIGAGGVAATSCQFDLTDRCDTNDSRSDVAPNGVAQHGGGTYLRWSFYQWSS